MAKHSLIVEALHDAQARCSCGGWTYRAPGARTRAQVEAAFKEHRGAELAAARRPAKACRGCGRPLSSDDDADFGWCRSCYFGGKFHERTAPKLGAALRALRLIPGVASAALEHTGGNNWWLMVRFAGVDDVDGHPAGRHVIAWEAIKLRDTRAWEMETGVPGLNGRWSAMLYSSKEQFEAGQGGGGTAELKPGATTAQLLAFVRRHARLPGRLLKKRDALTRLAARATDLADQDLWRRTIEKFDAHPDVGAALRDRARRGGKVRRGPDLADAVRKLTR